MDYRDVIYDQPSNASLSRKIKLVQYYDEKTSWKTLPETETRASASKLSDLMFMLVLQSHFKYNPKVYPWLNPFYMTPLDILIFLLPFLAGLSISKNIFFHVLQMTGTKLNHKICNSTSYLRFRNALINFIEPTEYKIFNINDQVGIEPLTRLLLGFS